MEKIRIFVVDDHKLFRAGVIGLLEGQSDFMIVGEAATVEDTLQCIVAQQPDIVLMDIDFGPNREHEGIDLTQEIKRTLRDQVQIIMLTMHHDDISIVDAFNAGARGFVLKGAELEQLFQTIRDVHQGKVVLSPKQAQRVFHEKSRVRATFFEEFPIHLTHKEKEILQLVAQGGSNREIAEQMEISDKTVRNRLSVIFGKLHVHNRTQASQYALKSGLLAEEQNPVDIEEKENFST